MPAPLEKPEVVLGFIPLTDCAPLVVARELGLFADQGLEVTLSRETSWANIRDKVAMGILDGAHMLAPMPLAMSLGVGPIQKPVVTALSLDLNGNAVTVSNSLYERMVELDPAAAAEVPVSARALKTVIEANRSAGGAPLTFAVVFPVSTHNYLLRYWMASAGIDPDRDINLLVVPPPQMVNNLRAGQIDGFCVGEPWNEVAVREGLGRVLTTSYEIWNNHPEKVFGVTEEWAEQNPETHQALLRALLNAMQWLDAADNRREAATLLARSIYVNAPVEVVRMSMLGTYQYSGRELPRSLPDFNVFYRYAASFPWRSHATLLALQMLRWGHITQPLDLDALARRTYRTDLYRQAAAALGVATPASDYKNEGEHRHGWSLDCGDRSLAMGPDRFFDGKVYACGDPVAHLNSFEMHHISVDRQSLARMNTTHDLQVAHAGGPESGLNSQ